MNKSRLLLLAFLAVQILGAYTLVAVNKASATEDLGGFVYGVGTLFEIADSPHLNITLASTEVVRVLLRSGPGMVSLVLESNCSAVSTVLTFEGFEANKTYGKYQDGCYITNITTDVEGRYTCTQDISEAHYVAIQEGRSTITIKADGTIDPPTAPINVVGNVYTFTANIYETLSVQKNGIIIDGDGHTLQGTEYHGIALYSRSDVTVRNVVVKGFWEGGITLWNSHNIQIRDNDVSGSGTGILLYNSDSNSITGNDVRTNSVGIGILWSSNFNIITCNNIADQYDFGVWTMAWCGGNLFYHNNFDNNVDLYNFGDVNTWDNGYPSGGNYWSDYTGIDADGDGIGDTPHILDSWNRDRYPFMMEYGWDTTPPEITTVIPEPYALYTTGIALDFYATDECSGVASVVGQLTNVAGELQEVESGFTPEAGVYTFAVVAADNAGNTVESDPVFFVVYDPEGGFATGGGWIYPDEESTVPGGKANFGFVARYKHDSSTGNLEFQYHDADVNLKSTTIDWLVISGVSAQFQGTATINGEGFYTFRVRAKDNGEPGVGSDEFVIKIWEGTDTESDPIHKAQNIISGGNIVVHKK